MELIDGLPITEYCDQRKLSVDARLKLFRTVCSAVQCASRRSSENMEGFHTRATNSIEILPELALMIGNEQVAMKRYESL